jgi:nucleoside-diphosphate-sugar epimerase
LRTHPSSQGTGFIGSAVVQELLGKGHDVVGLARSEKSAAALERIGASFVRGALEDLDILKSAAGAADGVIHTGYIHNFSPTADPAGYAQVDKNAIAAFGEALARTGKPLVVAAGLPAKAPGTTVTEDDRAPHDSPYPRLFRAVRPRAHRSGCAGAGGTDAPDRPRRGTPTSFRR